MNSKNLKEIVLARNKNDEETKTCSETASPWSACCDFCILIFMKKPNFIQLPDSDFNHLNNPQILQYY